MPLLLLFVTVIQPTLDNAATLTVHGAMKSGGTFFPFYILDPDSAADFAQLTTGSATTRIIMFRIGGLQYIKVVVGTNATSNQTFYVKGTDRE